MRRVLKLYQLHDLCAADMKPLYVKQKLFTHKNFSEHKQIPTDRKTELTIGRINLSAFYLDLSVILGKNNSVYSPVFLFDNDLRHLILHIAPDNAADISCSEFPAV